MVLTTCSVDLPTDVVGISFLLIREHLKMGLDLESDHSWWTVSQVLLFCLRIHGVQGLAREQSTIRQVMQ